MAANDSQMKGSVIQAIFYENTENAIKFFEGLMFVYYSLIIRKDQKCW